MSEDCPNTREVPLGMTWPWYAVSVELPCDRAKRPPVGYINSIDVPHGLDFVDGTRDQDNAVSCDALSLAQSQFLLSSARRGNKHSSQSVTRNATCFESEKGQTLHSCIHSYAQIAAVFPCHRSLEGLHDEAGESAIICKGLGAVMDRNACRFAQELVMGRFI